MVKRLFARLKINRATRPGGPGARGLLARATMAVACCCVLACAALAPAAWASSLSSVSVSFGSGSNEVGAGQQYFVSFTTTSPLNAGDTVTVAGPAGMLWSGQQVSYIVENNSGGYTVLAPPQLSNNGATVSLQMNPGVHLGAGQRVTLDMANVTNPTTPGNDTLSVSTTGDSTPSSSNSYPIAIGPPSQLSVQSGNSQIAQVGTAFASALSAKLTDQYGNPISGLSVSFTAPTAGAGGTFANGTSNDVETTNSSGVATSKTFTANTQPGGYQIQAGTANLLTAEFSLTNNPGPPSSMTIAAGNSQTERVGQALATPFEVAITDQYGNDLSGLNVTFTAPASGPSGTFAGSQTNSETDATNGSGVATASSFTAGPHAGSYKVQASVAGLNPVDFSVTNQVGPPRSLQIFSNNQSAKIDQPFALPLSALVLDQFGNPIAGQSVTFTAPTAGASGSFPTGATSETVTTGSTGYATSDAFTANATTGSYQVKASDGALASNFSLTNTPGPLTQPTGYLVVNSGPISTLSPSNTTGSVTCPATSTGVARYPQDGGVSFQSHSLYASVNSSYATGTSWSVGVKNRTGAATTFTVWAVCAVPNPGYVQLNSTSVPNAPGAQTAASEACPTGTKIIGGGVQNSSPNVTIYDSYPSGNSWVVHVDNPGITANSMYVSAVCSTYTAGTGYSVNQGSAVRAASSSDTGAAVSCPSGQAAVGGGISVGSLNTNVNLNSSAPTATGSGWTNLENNATPYSVGLTPWVICAA